MEEKNENLEFVFLQNFGFDTTEEKISTIIKELQKEKIVIMDGKLNDKEKKELIEKAMEKFNFKFKGIEMETIDVIPPGTFKKLKESILNFIFKGTFGFTIVGPASIVKKMKKDPNSIMILANKSKE